MVANFTGRKEVNAIFVDRWIPKKNVFILQATANAAYAAPGYLLFCRDKDLLAQGFDLQSFALTGEAATNLSEIPVSPQIRRAVYAVSDKGFLLASDGQRCRPFAADLVRP